MRDFWYELVIKKLRMRGESSKGHLDASDDEHVPEIVTL
jgi:hypothetical protein